MSSRMRHRSFIFAAAAAALAAAGGAQAQDNLSLLIDQNNATGGSPLAAFGYDPTTDTAYVASFGAGASLRKISGVTSGPQTVEVMVSAAQWELYYRNGDPNVGTGTPLAGGLLLNPQTIGSGTNSIAPYSQAWLTDGVRVPTTNTDPTRSMRIYQYNLQMVMPNPNPGKIPDVPPFYDGRDVFTTRVTMADMNTAAGQPASNTTSNTSRQFAWSSDGQTIYYNDSSTPLGGIWKANPLTGATSRIYQNSDILTEPAVTQLSPGVDRIYFRGSAATGNTTDGIDYIDHDGTTTTAASTLLQGTDVRDFMETTATMTIAGVAASASGDLFFSVQGGSGTLGTLRRAVLRYDTEGRLSKVLSYDERDLFFTGAIGSAPNPNANVAKMQPYEMTYDGGAGSFELTRVLYAEQSPVSLVGAFWAFKAGDFNRDNTVDQADIALFKQKLTVRGVPADTLDHKFDLNGNGSVDWKDVKVLQQFYAFADGDANIDQVVNLQDFNALAANFGLSGRIWTQGDFNGDDIVNLQDFNILASNFGLSAAGPDVTPDDWAALAAAVPEPASTTLLGLAALGLMRRRTRRLFQHR